jgi:hypothetical protein
MVVALMLAGPLTALAALVLDLLTDGRIAWYAPLLAGMAAPFGLIAMKAAISGTGGPPLRPDASPVEHGAMKPGGQAALS